MIILLWAVIGTSFHVQSTLSCNPTRIALEQALKFNARGIAVVFTVYKHVASKSVFRNCIIMPSSIYNKFQGA